MNSIDSPATSTVRYRPRSAKADTWPMQIQPPRKMWRASQSATASSAYARWGRSEASSSGFSVGASSFAVNGPTRRPSGAAVEPLAHRDVLRRVLARHQLAPHLAQEPEPLGGHVVLVDRLQVLLARGHEVAVGEHREALHHAADHLAHAVLDEPRAAVGLLDHGALVGALHQLVDLGGHRVLDDREQRLGVDVGHTVLGAADVERAEPALVVRGDRDGREDPPD